MPEFKPSLRAVLVGGRTHTEREREEELSQNRIVAERQFRFCSFRSKLELCDFTIQDQNQSKRPDQKNPFYSLKRYFLSGVVYDSVIKN